MASSKPKKRGETVEDVDLDIQIDQLRNRSIMSLGHTNSEVTRSSRPMKASYKKNVSSKLNVTYDHISNNRKSSIGFQQMTPKKSSIEPTIPSKTATIIATAISASQVAAETGGIIGAVDVDVTRSDTAEYFRQSKMKRELEHLQLDVAIFHEAKIMRTYFEDLISEANSYCKLLSEPITYELVLPEGLSSEELVKDATAYWTKLRSEIQLNSHNNSSSSRNMHQRNESLNPLLRRIPTGTARHLQYMHVLRRERDDLNNNNNTDSQQEDAEDVQIGASEGADGGSTATTRVLTMDHFVGEHKVLRYRVDKLSSLQPRNKKNYNINHLYIHGTGGVRSDFEYDGEAKEGRDTNKDSTAASKGANKTHNYFAKTTPKKSSLAKEFLELEGDLEQEKDPKDSNPQKGRELLPIGDITREELMNKLKLILENCVSDTRQLECQIADIQLRGWNVSF